MNDNTKLYMSLSQSKLDNKTLVTSAGKSLQIPENLMYSVGMVESNLDSKIKADTSSATGLYQFTGGTWKEQLALHGAEYGIPLDAKPTDATANAILGGLYLKNSGDNFAKNYGRAATPTDVYLGHFMGASGRNKFMKGMEKSPDAPALNFASSRQVKANHNIFYKKDGTPRTAKEVYSNFTNKLSLKARDYNMTDKAPSSLSEELSNIATQSQAPKEELASSTPKSALQGLMPESSTADTLISDNQDNKEAQDGEQKGFIEETLDVAKAEIQDSFVGFAAQETLLTHSGDTYLDNDIRQIKVGLGADSEGVFNPNAEPVDLDLVDVLMEQMGIDPKYSALVYRSTDDTSLKANLQLARIQQENAKVKSESSTGAQIVGGIAGAAANPTSYIPIVGQAKNLNFFVKAANVGAQSAGLALLEEGGMSAYTGRDFDPTMTATTAFGFGAGMTVIGESLSKVAIRMKSRQEAVDAGIPDPTLREPSDSPDGYRFENDELILNDGTVISHTNPITQAVRGAFDPDMAKFEFNDVSTSFKAADDILDFKPSDSTTNITYGDKEPVKARHGLAPTYVEEISMRVLRSDDTAVRDIGEQLFRPLTGVEGGGIGNTKITAEDLDSMFQQRDNYTQFEIQKASQNIDTDYDTILEAIEAGRIGDLAPNDKNLAELIQKNMIEKGDDAMNPAKFGDKDAPAVFETGRDSSRHFPSIYDDVKMTAAKMLHKGAEGLQNAIKGNWLKQYKANHNGVQDALKKMYEDSLPAPKKGQPKPKGDKKGLDLFVKKYIERKSYGIAQTGDFNYSSVLLDANEATGLVGIQNNNFAAERNIFDNAFQSVENGIPMKMNDLRLTDLPEIVKMYNRRISGDVALHAATGKTTKELKDAIVALPDSKAKDALAASLKVFTGRARRDAPNLGGMIAGALKDLTFATKNFGMPFLQLTDAAGFFADRTMKIVRGGMPTLNHVLNPEAKFTRAELDSFQSSFFGLEMSRTYEGSFKAYRDMLSKQEHSNITANLIGGVRSFTNAIAQEKYNPMTRLLTKTTEAMIRAARGSAIADIADEVMLGIPRKFTEAQLHSYSITTKQYDAMLKAVKKNMKVVDGEYKMDTERFKQDPDSLIFWRLADNVANDTVNRAGKAGQRYANVHNAAEDLVLQFKSFMFKSLNNKFARMLYETGQGKSVDHALHAMLSVAMGTGGYAGMVHVRALGLPEDKQEAYKEKMLDPATVAYQGFTRSSVFGAAGGAANMMMDLATGNDIFTAGRTTLAAVPEPTKGKQGMGTYSWTAKEELAKRVGNQIPALNTAISLATLPSNVYGAATSEGGYEQLSHQTALIENLKQILPIDPVTQRLIHELGLQMGVLETTY